MPHLLWSMSDNERADAIDALVAFLSVQRQPFETIKAGGAMPVVNEFWSRGDANHGRELYHTVGCVACHAPDEEYETSETKLSPMDELIEQLDPEELAELGLTGAARRVDSVPHGELAAKYSSRSLTIFLLDPSKRRPGARMPALRLSPGEAADISAFLLQKDGVANGRERTHKMSEPSDDQGLIDKGRSLFVQLRCANCHQANGVTTSLPAKPLAELKANAATSCFKKAGSGMPRFGLDARQIAAVVARLDNGDGSNEHMAEERVHFRMLQLNCYACHQRDTNGGIGRYRKVYFDTVEQVDLGDEGRLPPPLTGVGRKLLPKALKSVFATDVERRRPYMTIRMPAYPNDAVESLVRQLPVADHAEALAEQEVFGRTDELAGIGRELVNTGCVECHPFRGESLPGVVGIDLKGISDRVQPSWFYEFVLDPGAVKNRTRMPTFFPNGKSNRTDILKGNV